MQVWILDQLNCSPQGMTHPTPQHSWQGAAMRPWSCICCPTVLPICWPHFYSFPIAAITPKFMSLSVCLGTWYFHCSADYTSAHISTPSWLGCKELLQSSTVFLHISPTSDKQLCKRCTCTQHIASWTLMSVNIISKASELCGHSWQCR